MVNYLVWIILGAIMGWLASLIRLPNGRREVRIDIAVGIIGAFVAGLAFTPLFGLGSANPSDFSLLALEVSLLGAIILLGVVKFLRRLGASAA
jgi:uncharacterized membrane protein YeaQ/YmgE (transglycosylase-associated protein family)